MAGLRAGALGMSVFSSFGVYVFSLMYHFYVGKKKTLTMTPGGFLLSASRPAVPGPPPRSSWPPRQLPTSAPRLASPPGPLEPPFPAGLTCVRSVPSPARKAPLQRHPSVPRRTTPSPPRPETLPRRPSCGSEDLALCRPCSVGFSEPHSTRAASESAGSDPVVSGRARDPAFPTRPQEPPLLLAPGHP